MFNFLIFSLRYGLVAFWMLRSVGCVFAMENDIFVKGRPDSWMII